MVSFFEERPPSFGGLRRGDPHVANPLSTLSPNKEVHSNNNLIREIENYNEGTEVDTQVQPLDPP